MNKKGWMMLRVLINRYNPQASNALLKFLPPEEAQAVRNQNIRSHDLKPLLQQPQTFLNHVHYSWIQPLLEKFPLHLRPVVTAILTPEQITGLKASSLPKVSQPVKNFMMHQLYLSSGMSDHLPLEYLPETELSLLSQWNKQQLTHLFDFLGLHDLASEVRHIVNRHHLTNIYSCLSPKQFYYLKLCLHQKEQIVSPKLGIDPTVQNCDKLKQMIHKRGLQRFGRALCGQHPDFVWHIAHILDRGRGKILLQNYTPDALPKITPALKQQVLNLMNFFKSE